MTKDSAAIKPSKKAKRKTLKRRALPLTNSSKMNLINMIASLIVLYRVLEPGRSWGYSVPALAKQLVANTANIELKQVNRLVKKYVTTAAIALPDHSAIGRVLKTFSLKPRSSTSAFIFNLPKDCFCVLDCDRTVDANHKHFHQAIHIWLVANCMRQGEMGTTGAAMQSVRFLQLNSTHSWPFLDKFYSNIRSKQLITSTSSIVNICRHGYDSSDPSEVSSSTNRRYMIVYISSSSTAPTRISELTVGL